MRHYQLTYLISEEATEEELTSLPSQIINLISDSQGIIEKEEKPVKIKLGQPIKKQNFAFLSVIDFYLDKKDLKEICKKLKENKKILRYLILAKRQKEKKPEKIMLKSEESAEKKEIKTMPREEKVELGQIDEKIDEILKE